MRVLLFGVVLVALTAMSRVAEPAVEYWPMYCRTGGSMLSGLRTLGNGRNEFSISFHKSTGPAGEWGVQLRPGECGFPDRPLNASEATRVVVNMPAAQMPFQISTFVFKGEIKTVLSSDQLSFVAERFVDNTTYRIMVGNSVMKPGSRIRWVTDRGLDEERRD
jgi:hypothetical protein